LKFKNPEAAHKKLNILANKAKLRRDMFINKCDLDKEENEFESKLIFIFILPFYPL
jgi:hypothetical protein